MKTVNVTVQLTVPDDVHIQELINEMGYQFTYIDENEKELILDSEITNVVEWE